MKKVNAVETLLSKYYLAYENSNYLRAKWVLLKLLKMGEKTFWIYSCLSSCYYELFEYKIALKYSKIAFKLNPKSPLVLWHYAGVLAMLNKETEAIKLYRRIMKNSAEDIGKRITTEGLVWARKLLNDCEFKLAQCYYYLNKDELALQHLNKFLQNKRKGVKSIFTKIDIKKMKDKLKDSFVLGAV